MNPVFGDIDHPSLLKQLPPEQLEDYAAWLRRFLIEKISEYGGHFAANLGVVELSIALHYVYNTPEDILIWDVGHQAYAHKILTGRQNDFHSLRSFGGISGFPKMSESIFDPFGTAHSSTSISATLGYAAAASLQQIKRQHIAVIGDGALSAGQAFEALNNAGLSGYNITVVINDNHIGIDPSQGAMGEYLEKLQNKKENLFTDFGFEYFGPLDGHNLKDLITVFEMSKNIETPKLIHVRTVKGKGHSEAEAEQTKWHSTQRFDKVSGNTETPSDKRVKYQDIFGKTLLELAEEEPTIVAVTPAMISGSSLHFMQEKFPSRVFDVGIAEQHAVTFSAGMAASGLIPFCCIYSTFLQRAYDQLIHDVALQNLPVIFAVDRAGLVGEDGPTHHGVFDIAFLQTLPNVTIVSPRNQEELRNAMYTAVFHQSGPFVLRYPRGKADENFSPTPFKKLPVGVSECLRESGSEIVLISVGTLWKQCAEAIEGKNISHYDLRFIKPLDHQLLNTLFHTAAHIFVVEEAQETGGVASSVLLYASQKSYNGKIHSLAIKDHFVPHGSMGELYEEEGFSAPRICKKIEEILQADLST